MKTTREQKVSRARRSYLALLKRTKRQLRAAHWKWDCACLPMIRSAKTIEQARAAFRASPWGTQAKKWALEKWAEFCTEPKELAKLFRATCARFKLDNPALQRWRNISMKEVEKANTAEEIMTAFRQAPPWALDDNFLSGEDRTLVQDVALKKLLDLCTTVGDVTTTFKRMGGHDNTSEKAVDIYRARCAALMSPKG